MKVNKTLDRFDNNKNTVLCTVDNGGKNQGKEEKKTGIDEDLELEEQTGKENYYH
jgi:hypothetical protein